MNIKKIKKKDKSINLVNFMIKKKDILIYSDIFLSLFFIKMILFCKV